MQLNHSNGAVIIIDEIYVNRNRVDYTLYEYGGSSISRKYSHPFTSITLTDYLTQDTNFEVLCHETLALEIDTQYTISEDIINWVIELGSTTDPTTLRVYIPATTLNTVTHTGNSLDLLLKAMEALSQQVVRLANGAHQYLIVLEDEHKALLETYPEIIIEYKA